MKLYTIYSPSHEKLYVNYFLQSAPIEFQIKTLKIDQECPSGEFYTNGWSKTCFRKIKYFEQACLESQGELFVFSDVDIQFFGNIKDILIQELGDKDIACQDDSGNIVNPNHRCCSGFFVCRGNKKTLNMFRQMRENYFLEDQTTLNNYIHLVDAKLLSKKFFNIGHLINKVWEGEDFTIPYPVLVHHANWTKGIHNKIKLLDIVKQKIYK
jgi:hypothetical protein